MRHRNGVRRGGQLCRFRALHGFLTCEAGRLWVCQDAYRPCSTTDPNAAGPTGRGKELGQEPRPQTKWQGRRPCQMCSLWFLEAKCQGQCAHAKACAYTSREQVRFQKVGGVSASPGNPSSGAIFFSGGVSRFEVGRFEWLCHQTICRKRRPPF